VKHHLRKMEAFVFYTHPWEVDPRQPRVEEAATNFKFRHYINLNRTEKKVSSLVNAMPSVQFTGCKRYLDSVTNWSV